MEAQKPFVMALEDRKAERAAFMRALYAATGGDEMAIINASEVFAVAELPVPDDRELRALLKYLEGEYLIEVIWTGGPSDQALMIRHSGVVEVERLTEFPNEATEHFPPLAQVIIYGDMINSNIANASTHVGQSVALSADAVRAWADDVIAAVLADDNLTSAERAVVLQSAEILREQSAELEANDPKRLRSLGNGVVSFLVGIASSATYEGLVLAGQRLFN